MGCVNATLAKRRLNPQYLKLSEEEFIKLNHLIMITNLRPIDIMRIVQEFRKIDVDRSGTISAREFFHHYSCRDTQFARRAMTIMDDQPPGNMSLDLVEFCAALYNYCTYDRDTLLWFIFHLFDEDDSGTLEALEFKDLISFVYCRPLTPTVQALVEKHGVAPTGFISRDQFVKRCREAPLLVAPAFELQRALLVQKNYPWLQDTTHFVNASGATSYAWSMLRPLLPKNTQRKVHIHGAGAAQSLTEEVRPDFLPEQLGGRAACRQLRPPVSLEEHDRGVVGSPLRSPRQSPRAGPRSIEVEVNETSVPTAVVVPGVEYVCHDHNHKGKRTRKALRLRDRSLELLPTARWRLSRQMLRLRSPKRLSLASHQPLAAYVGAADAALPSNAAAHHREASIRARDLPASFVVLATPKQQVVTLELADAAQARALVEAIHMQADLAA